MATQKNEIVVTGDVDTDCNGCTRGYCEGCPREDAAMDELYKALADKDNGVDIPCEDEQPNDGAEWDEKMERDDSQRVASELEALMDMALEHGLHLATECAHEVGLHEAFAVVAAERRNDLGLADLHSCATCGELFDAPFEECDPCSADGVQLSEGL